jgi:hypothetical protein
MSRGAASLRQMRIFHAVFLAATLLQIHNAERLAGNGTGFSTTFLIGIVFVASFDVLVAYHFRRKTIFPASEKLRRDPNDMEALKQWRKATIVVLVLAMSIGLYGLILRVLGASRRVAWPFFLLALILMLAWRPQLDLSGDVPIAESTIQ